MIKIAVEASLANASCPTGLGVYVNKLLEGLALYAPDEYRFYLFHFQKEWNGPDYGERFEPVSYHFTSQQSLAIMFNLDRTLKKVQADLFHVTCTTGAPPICSVPVISTIHDIYPLTHGTGVSFRSRMFFRLLFPWTVKNSSLLLCNSEFTGNELIKTGISAEKIRVVYPASQLDFSRTVMSPELENKSYILCVGAVEPRKGQVMLAEAYRMAAKKNPSLPELLFIGPDRGDGHLLERYGKNSGIRWLRYVSTEDLTAYYQHASLFICPSLFEGFGIPVLEALSAGIPVICSDLPVFREIAGDSACYVHPDRESFSKILLDFIERKVIFDLEKTRKCSASFSWEKNVKQTLADYQLLLEISE